MNDAGGRPQWILVAALAMLAASTSITNGFVYDDIPIVLQNELVHRLGHSTRIWTSAYWPAGLLYRPVTVQLFALEWAAGGGRPIAFHLTSVVLSITTAFLLWRLARRVLPPMPALVAAALFAVHPVHVEVVANVVGQAELLATLFALIVVERYLAWRSSGPLAAAQRLALAALTLLSILSKETGYVVPGLLLVAELLVVQAGENLRAKLRNAGPALLLQGVAVLAAVLIRIAVIGPTAGAGPAVAFRDLPATERIVGMLAVVPHGFRLLWWPAHLQAEYGPPGLSVAGPIGPAHVLGLVLLLGTVGFLAISRRRAPVAALAALWVLIAVFPVSNILTPTGVILAERTLFLPSVGAMLLVGAGFAALMNRIGAAGRGTRQAVIALTALLVAAGAARSMERQLVWRSPEAFFDRLVRDAPDTYRAQLVASVYYLGANRLADSERTARRGLELYQDDPQLYELLGQALRQQKRCAEAVPVLADGARRFPSRTVVRSRLIECTLAVGDTAGARARASEAVALGYSEFEQTVRRLSPAAKPRSIGNTP